MQLIETLNYIFAEIIMIKQLCFVNKRPTGLDGHLNAIAFKSTCLHLKLYFTCSLDLNSRFLRLFSPTFILCCLQTANPFKDNVERGKSQRSLGLFIVYLQIEAKNCKRLVNRDLQTLMVNRNLL